MDDAQQILLHTLVGEYLASGFTNGEILELLEKEQELSAEGAQAVLRGVFDSWSSVREGLNLQAEDDRNWHHHLRMRLLQRALKDESAASQNLALRVLDSLANLQGITTSQAQPVEIKPMVEKLVLDPQKEDKQNIVELTNKLNEVIESVGRRPRPAVSPPQPSKLQYVEYLEKMGQRIRSGPLMFIRQEDPNELTQAIEDALGVLQDAVVAYKESLTTDGG